ncbi:MAG TPA: sucrase ferredoxin [Gaiellaceae bacterium]|nr:sucrase ferredoxin [Gaiellaceae bacterium]
MSGRCAELSEAAGELLSATAVTARSWLLLEVPGTWPRDVVDGGVLPEAAEEAVSAWLDETPGSRLQFVRRPGRAAGSLLAFVVRAEEAAGSVRRIQLEAHDDLSALDLASAGEPMDDSLVLVCGHGTRDRCCALRGTAVYTALAERLGEDEVWISSHQGGHRFAANVLVLPAGIQFGRVVAEQAAFLVARALAGRIDLAHYRGRTCYEPRVQAAERLIREEGGFEGVGDLRLIDASDGTVRFRAWDGSEYAAKVEQISGPAVSASCGAEPEPQRAFAARLL